MEKESKTELKVGITVFFSILLFLIVFAWAKNYGVSGNRIEYNIAFSSVSGLEVGDVVTVNGVKQGNVEKIDLKHNSVIVKISLDKSIKLSEDSKFYVAMLDLMGGKKVEILPGDSEKLIDNSKVIAGFYSADISTVMATAGVLLDKLPKMMVALDSTLQLANSYLGDREIKGNIKSILSDLTIATGHLKTTLIDNKSNIDSILKGGSALVQRGNSLLQKNSPAIENSLLRANELLEKSNTLISKLDLMVDETKNSKNNVGKLLYDEKLVKELNETLLSVKKLTDTLNYQLNNRGVNVDAKINLFK